MDSGGRWLHKICGRTVTSRVEPTRFCAPHDFFSYLSHDGEQLIKSNSSFKEVLVPTDRKQLVVWENLDPQAHGSINSASFLAFQPV